MKKFHLLLTVLALNIGLLCAQPPQGGQRMTVEERAKSITQWMTEELKLTSEQIEPVDSINLLYAKTQQAYFQAADGDRDKIREGMVILETEKEKSLSKVLTTEQLDLYKAKIKEMKNMGRKRR